MEYLRQLARWVHFSSGFAAVALGLVVMLLPKFGVRSYWHRRAGQVYALLIGSACVLGVPLAYLRNNNYLMILGVMTLAVVVSGWLDGIGARSALVAGDRDLATSRFRWHLIMMGASYIGAWSGFFATNPILGTGTWQIWFYVFGPSLIGAVFIGRAASSFRLPSLGSLNRNTHSE